MIANNIEELFGTLQQSVVGSWRKHLKTSKYSAHMALDEYYKEMPELIDNLIEHWMGTHGKVEEYKNLIDSTSMSAIQYLSELMELTKNGYDLLEGDKDLESDLDAIASQIKSTLYKLKELKESRGSLVDALNNSINERFNPTGVSMEKLKKDVCDALEKIDIKWGGIEKEDMEGAFEFFMTTYY